MTRKIAVVTGGNRGIGYEIVKALVQEDADVALVSRNPERGRAAREQLLAAAPSSRITVLPGDLGSVAGVHQLAADLLAHLPRIDLLINNAGIWPTQKEINADGLEMGFMVNFLAPFMLSHLLSERLRASAPARIIHVNAGLYVKGKIDLARTPYGADFGRLRTYANSKLCHALTLNQEAALLAPHNVTVNMVHPGVVNTDLGIMGGPMGWLLKRVKRSWLSPAEGAIAPVWLATSAEVAGQTGQYFNEKEVIPLAAVARDEELGRALWQLA
ncbi:MAG: SDR family NAD(P)-dependent oxidoreductase, partial [Anaerolineales bacterium]|nr:SDR family NAD(P)-dependent oxidoreductase [Anaerolineales bacterium]